MAKKNAVSKKIAGVKVPKVLRKNTLIKSLLGSPAGRQIIADALLAAATAAATALVAAHPKAVAKAGTAVANAGEDAAQIAKNALKSAAGALSESLSDAAKSALGTDTPRSKQERSSRTH